MWNPLDMSWHWYWFVLGAACALWAAGLVLMVGTGVGEWLGSRSRGRVAELVPDVFPAEWVDESEWVGEFPAAPRPSSGGTFLACGHSTHRGPVVFVNGPDRAPLFGCPEGCGPQEAA